MRDSDEFEEEEQDENVFKRNLRIGKILEDAVINALKRIGGVVDIGFGIHRDAKGRWTRKPDQIVYYEKILRKIIMVVECKNYPSFRPIDKLNFYDKILSRFIDGFEYWRNDEYKRVCVLGVPYSKELVRLLYQHDISSIFIPSREDGEEYEREIEDFIQEKIEIFINSDKTEIYYWDDR